ncbi:MAG: hypothetical protein LBS60_04340 [Deltaproteobacteria bacterium]|jgi:hypothetical protein|nr:hypothetical protein [Deltaproteobacteria bacterium]
MGETNRRIVKSNVNLLGEVGRILAITLVLTLVVGLNWATTAWAADIGGVYIGNSPADDGKDNATISQIGGNVIIYNVSDPTYGANPQGNTVIVNGTVSDDYMAVVGGANFTANSHLNTVIVNGTGHLNGTVFGGVAVGNFNATNNTVLVNTSGGVSANGANFGDVFGGTVVSGVSANNTVTFINGTIERNLVGGSTIGNGTVRDNEVIINALDEAKVHDVFGALSNASGSNLLGNNVTIYNGTILSNVKGAWMEGDNGTISNNKVLIYNGSIAFNVFGGDNNVTSANPTNVTYNKVEIHGGIIGDNITGGRSGSGRADYNTVDIDDSTDSVQTSRTNTNIFGGFSHNGSVTGNNVTIHTQDVLQANNISGGWSDATTHSVSVKENKVNVSNVNASHVIGGYSGNGTVSQNQVIVENTNASDSISGGISQYGTVEKNEVQVTSSEAEVILGGGSLNGDVKENKVYITGSNITQSVYGGDSVKGDVSSNEVYIESSSVLDRVSGGWTDNGSATSNSAEIKNSDVKNAFGGYTLNGSAYSNEVSIANSNFTEVFGGYSNATGDAYSNEVFVSSGSVGDNVTGGYSRVGSATGNKVTLSGSPNITGYVLGGLVGTPGTGIDNRTGNRLVLDQYDPTGTPVINTVANFQYYDYILPQSVASGFVALNAQNIDIGDQATVSVDIYGGSYLDVGDNITLMQSATAIQGNLSQTEIEGDDGFFFKTGYNLSIVNNALVAEVISAPVPTDRTKSLTETAAARLAFLNQAQDYVADQGLTLAKARAATEGGIGVFAGVSGGKSRYETGSHVDLTGVNALIGVSMGNFFDQNRLTVGVFGEFGGGSYDSHTPVRGGAVDAEGDVSYAGAGLMARYDIESSGGTLYLEASGRAGHSNADYRATNVRIGGRRPKYQTSGTYVGAHMGAGYDFRATEEANVDVFFKYLWTRQFGSDQKVLGQRFTLEDADSSRIKTGTRVTYNYTDFIKPYIGGSYIYEFDGETDARVRGLNLPNADLEGSSGTGELGITLLSDDTIPISLDLGVQGHFGKRSGASGSVDIKYEF